MLYNDTTNNYMGVLTSPPILVNNTITVRFEALTTNRNLTKLQVYYGSALGQVICSLNYFYLKNIRGILSQLNFLISFITIKSTSLNSVR